MEIFTIFPSWLLTTALVFFTFLYTLRSNRSSITAPKLPPNPPKLPIIGNLHKLIGKPRHQAFWQLSKEYGPIMLFYIGSKPYLIIPSPAMAKQVLKTQDHIFCSRPLSKGVKRITYNYLDIAFSPQSDHRREMRKILVSEFLGSHPPNVAVNLNKLFLATVKGVVCKVAFGNNYRQQPIKGPSWEVLVDEALEMLGGWLGDSFPWAGRSGPFKRFCNYVSGWNDKLETCFTNLDAYIESIIDDHKNQIVEVTDDEKDFVHALLDLSSEDNTSGHRLTKEDVKALIMVNNTLLSFYNG
ncbi:putative cytochrome P450 [Helianthus anomalus]